MSANCTKITARYVAGSLDVCRVGSLVALHFATGEGTIIIRMRERDFVKGARSPTDYHGHPFRTLEQLDAEKSLLVEALDSAEPAKAEGLKS